MFSFSFNIFNPLRKELSFSHKFMYWKDFKLSDHKVFYVHLGADDSLRNIVGLDVSLRTKQSHAGFYFILSLLWLDFQLEIYDNRHWDYNNNCWETDD